MKLGRGRGDYFSQQTVGWLVGLLVKCFCFCNFIFWKNIQVQTKLHIVYMSMLQVTRSNIGFDLYTLIHIYIWVLKLTRYLFIIKYSFIGKGYNFVSKMWCLHLLLPFSSYPTDLVTKLWSLWSVDEHDLYLWGLAKGFKSYAPFFIERNLNSEECFVQL